MMTDRFRWLTGFALVALLSSSAFAETEKLNKKIEHLSLIGLDGKKTDLASLTEPKTIVLVFLSFECPVSNAYAQSLTELSKAYADKGVAFLGICPTDEQPSKLAEWAKEYKLPFPVYVDAKGEVADAVKATMTPEVIVLDHNRVMRYRGRIDNTWAARLRRNSQTTEFDLKNALDDLLDGKAVRVPITKAVGCTISIGKQSPDVAPNAVTFYKDVLPILQNNCQSCHRPGEVGPFSLMTYKQSVNWASDIKEYTQSRKMPPWKPTPESASFHAERKMSDADIQTLAKWVDAGTPEGDPKLAPPAKVFTPGWKIGTPDLVLTVGDDFTVGPSGHDIFRCFVMPTNLTEDKYVVAFEVRPGNSQIVHHTLNFFDSSGTARKLELDEAKKENKGQDHGPGYSVAMGVGFRPTPAGADGKPTFGGLGGWAPGQMPHYLPEGSGYFLPKGSDIVLQVHYHRNGKEEKDRTQIGLYFAKAEQKIKPYRSIVIPGRFTFIPPNVEKYAAKGSIWCLDDTKLHSVMPHMHLLGKKIKVSMTTPDGKTKVLVDVQDWDYNWQETYWFKNEIVAPAGTRFDIEAVYDNSKNNPNNPSNPPRLVLVGEQTTNEMLFGFIGCTSDAPGRLRFSVEEPKK